MFAHVELELHGVRQGHHRIVVSADVQMVLVDHEVAGAGTVRAEAEVVRGALRLVADEQLVVPAAGRLGRRSEQREGTLVAVPAGDHGHVHAAIEGDHVPDSAAEDLIGVVVGRVVEQVLLRADDAERILTGGRVRGGHDVGAAFGGAVLADHAGDQLVVNDRQAADAHRHGAVGHLGARVHGLDRVGGRIDLDQVRGRLRGGREVQLVVEFDGGAVAGDAHAVHAPDRALHDTHLAGAGVDLEQQAVVLAAVEEQVAVEQHVDARLQRGVVGAQLGGHDLERAAHGGVAGADVHPVAVAHGGPGVALAAVVGTLARGGVAVRIHVEDAVIRAQRGVRVGDLRGAVPVLLRGGDAGRLGGGRGRGAGDHHRDRRDRGGYGLAQTMSHNMESFLSACEKNTRIRHPYTPTFQGKAGRIGGIRRRVTRERGYGRGSAMDGRRVR